MDISGHPLWSVIVILGAIIATGLQLRMLRRRGVRVTWFAVLPLLVSAAAGAGFADRFENLYPWRVDVAQTAADCTESMRNLASDKPHH